VPFDKTEIEESNILVSMSIITLSVPSSIYDRTQIMSVITLILICFSSIFIFGEKDAASGIITVTVLLTKKCLLRQTTIGYSQMISHHLRDQEICVFLFLYYLYVFFKYFIQMPELKAVQFIQHNLRKKEKY